MPADFELMPRPGRSTRAGGAPADADLLGHMVRIAALFKAGTLDATGPRSATSPASRTWTA